VNDLRHAARQLGRRPGFSATVILMLAIGIGATTAIFTLFHEVLVRPLPVLEPERLVNLSAPGPKRGSTTSNEAGSSEDIFSYPMFRDLQAQQAVFTDIAAHRQFYGDFAYDGESSAGSGMLVSGSYFSVLGLRPAIGRLLDEQDEQAIGESAVVVLSHDQWQNRFGADPEVLGRTIVVNGQTLTIVGVAPAGFTGTTVGNRAQVFVPITLRWLMEPTRARDHEDRRAYWVYLFARLRPDISLGQADAAINTIFSGIVNELEVPLQSNVPAEILEQFRQRRIVLAAGERGQSAVAAGVAEPLTLLLGVTALVLLIVCVNIANLLLVRGAGRTGEMAIRASVGAGRGRLAAQLLAEASLLAAAGGVASVPVAYAVLAVVTGLLPNSLAGGFGVELGGSALLVTAGATFVTLLAFGALPALQGTRVDAGTLIKGQASRAMGGRGAARVRSSLAVVQIAFSTVLLALAGLFTQSLGNIGAVELGLEADSLITFTVSPRRSGYSAERSMQVYDRIEQELAAQPGVVDVAASRILLFDGRQWSAGTVTIDGVEREPVAGVLLNAVSPSFLRTLSIPLLDGRNLADSDAEGAPPVAVVNESFVRRFDLGTEAVGQRIRLGNDLTIEIVGVFADAKYTSVKDDIGPQFFIPRHQFPNLDAVSFYLRGAIDAAALLELVPRAVAAVDPSVAVSRLMTMRTQIDDDLYAERLVTLLSAAFAVLATLLAAIGLYGVLAYNVRQRTRELGLRLALGASPVRLRAAVLKQVALMALIGLPVGIVGAVLIARTAEALLFGLSGYDPAVLGATLVIVGAVVFAAGVLPARSASRVAPMEALRYE
jgi:putative ABC transport system permease protein